jgi:hypothetical protein
MRKLLGIAALVVGVACGSSSNPPGRVAAPMFSPPPGTYTSAQSVTIVSTTAGATVHYTDDGSAPSGTSPACTSPVAVTSTLTLRAIATKPGLDESDAVSATYTIVAGSQHVAAPTFSPPAGSYTSAQTVVLATTTPGAAIHYTLDGASPSAASAAYAGPIAVSSTTTIKAVAIATGYTDSPVASATYTILVAAAAPNFSVPAGTYTSTQSVALATTTPGAAIHYTLDGSTPSVSSATYGAPIAVSTTTTLKAIATAAGFTDSPVASATYTIVVPAAAPAFSVAAGTYTGTQSVVLTSSTPGAAIYYTLDGTNPTTSSTLYSGPIAVSTTTTVKAIAVAAGFTDSPAASATYTIVLPAAVPTFSVAGGAYTSPQSVALSSATPGAAIHYTTDGSPPSASSATYTGPIAVASTTTIKAITTAAGFADSLVASATFTILLPAATPTFSVPAGTYTSAQSVSLTSATPGAAIYYTVDGSIPTVTSTAYTAPIAVASTTTIKAIAVASGFSASAVGSATYTINLPPQQVAAPTFSPAGGSYTSGQTVALATATPGATIHYTLDGAAPSASSATYGAPIAVSTTTTLKAIAVKAGLTDSPIASATYTIVVPAAAPTNSVPAGTYTSAQSVALATTTAGAAIYYTLDGTAPTTASTLYTVPIDVSSTTTIRAIAVAPGLAESSATSATYTILLPAAAPTFSVPAGAYTSAQSVALATTTAGATIHYTLDGSTPTPGSTLYSGPIPVSSPTTIKTIAMAAGFSDSPVASATYTILLPAAAPTFTPGGGTYTTDQIVALATTTAGATIHYTLDGSLPTTASTSYTAPITVSTNTTIKAIVAAAGFTNSPAASATYTILVPAAAPTFSPAAGTYASAQSVTLATATPGATIYYTIDGSAATTSSTLYTTPITLSSTTTIRAFAAASGFSDSAGVSATYTIENLPQAAAPTFSPPGGSYASAQTVALATTTPGATIYYTVDGSTPNTASTAYAGAFTVSATATVQAIAAAPGHTASTVASATYTIATGGAQTLAVFCQNLFDAEVAKFLACYHANPDYRLYFAGFDFCATLTKEVSSGRVSYDGTQAAACLSEFQGLTCIDMASGATLLSAACSALLTPHVQPGGSCYEDADCVAGSCSETVAVCPGSCESYLQLGDACGAPGTTAECAPQLVCDAAFCKQLAIAGGECPCTAGLWCDTADNSVHLAGTCKPQQTEGGACTAFGDQCVVGYWCVGASTTAGTPGTCRALVGLGGDCTESDFVCGLGYYCDPTKKCAPYPGLGGDCSTSFACLDGYCNLLAAPPTCAAWKKQGEACGFMLGSCGPGLTCDVAGTDLCITTPGCVAP